MGVKRLDKQSWEVLIRRIKDGTCTPILGAGIYAEGPSIRTNVARKWADEYEYPLGDGGDLARVARFLTVQYADAEFAAGKYVEELNGLPEPNFENPTEPYTILAKLPLPIYITTNYDNFMEQALKKRNREVKMDYCRWM